MEELPKTLLIVGLGNPGSKYEKTRHNAGFLAVDFWAKKHFLIFQKDKQLQGQLASGSIDGLSIYVLKPETYMNKSGLSVKSALKTLKILPSAMLVIHDDLDVEFDKVKFKPFGSHGGQKGVRDIQEMIGTQYFARIRFGIGFSDREDAADYVLDDFTEEEIQRLPQLFELTSQAIDTWIQKGSEAVLAMLSKSSKIKDSYKGEKTNESI